MDENEQQLNELNAWGEEPDWAQDPDDGRADDDDVVGGGRPSAVVSSSSEDFAADHTLVLIDCGDDMFDPCGDNGATPFDQTLRETETLMRETVNHVATSGCGKRDGVGVLLWRARTDDENQNDFATHRLLLPIEPPGVRHVKAMRRFVAESAELERRFRRRTRSANDDDEHDRACPEDGVCPLRSALREASRLFHEAKCVKKNPATSRRPDDSKTVWIFTNDDDPCRDLGPDEVRRVEVTVKDVANNGVHVRLYPVPVSDRCRRRRGPLPRSNHDHQTNGGFDRGIFYDRVLTEPEDAGHKWKRVRKAFTLPLLLPNQFGDASRGGRNHHHRCRNVLLDFFRLTTPRTPRPVDVSTETSRATNRVSQIVNASTGEIVDPRDANLVEYLTFAGEKVRTSRDELASIRERSNTPPSVASLKLSGFRPENSIPLHHTLDRSYYVVPSNDDDGSSRNAFSHLHDAMRRRRVIGVGELLTRATTTSRLVSVAVRDDDDEAPGWIVTPLPFADDVRRVDVDVDEAFPFSRPLREDDVVARAAAEVVQRQKPTEKVAWGEDFRNPALRRFWNYIESVALGGTTSYEGNEEDEDENDEDDTLLDEKAVLEVAGPQIETFMNALPPSPVLSSSTTTTTTKRSRKTDLPRDAVGLDAWMLENFRLDVTMSVLEQCGMDDLKNYLRFVGAKVGGKKKELMERVRSNVENRVRAGELVEETSSSAAAEKKNRVEEGLGHSPNNPDKKRPRAEV